MVDGKFQKVEGSDRELPADFVFLAMGFVGPDKGSWLSQLGVAFDDRGNVARNEHYMSSVPGVFIAGDMGRGQSLIVWAIAEGRSCAAITRTTAPGSSRRALAVAIAEGRSCAAGADAWLMGETQLPLPIAPTARPLQ